MAQIDSRIALGFQPQTQLESPTNALAKMMQIQGLQQQNQLGQMKMDEARYAGERRNKLAALLQGQYETPEARESALLQGGFMDEATKLGTDRRANQKSDLDIDTTRQKLATERYTTFKKTLGALSQRPDLTKEMAIQAGQELVAAGIIPAEMYQQSIAGMPDDPVALRARLRDGITAQMTPEQMFTVFAPTPTEVNSGQQKFFKDTNPNSPTFGQVVGGAPTQMQITPDAQLSSDTSISNNKRSTAASYANASATRSIADATREAAGVKDRRDTEMKFADDYRTQSKTFKEVSDAYKQIGNTLDKATTSPAATLAGATKFMKLLDPGSVVRESELGMALAASGVLDRAANYYQTLLRGKVLTPTQVKDFKNITSEIYKAAKDQQLLIDADYKSKAKGNNLRPEMIIQDLGQGAGSVVDFGSLR